METIKLPCRLVKKSVFKTKCKIVIFVIMVAVEKRPLIFENFDSSLNVKEEIVSVVCKPVAGFNSQTNKNILFNQTFNCAAYSFSAQACFFQPHTVSTSAPSLPYPYYGAGIFHSGTGQQY